MEEIIEMAKKIGAELKKTPEFEAYQKAKAKYDSDEQLQAIIGEFNLKKMAAMNEINKGDKKDEALIARMQDEIRLIYMNASEHPTMIEFLAAKEKLETMVNNVHSVINFAITGEVQGCSGKDCASCGACH